MKILELIEFLYKNSDSKYSKLESEIKDISRANFNNSISGDTFILRFEIDEIDTKFLRVYTRRQVRIEFNASTLELILKLEGKIFEINSPELELFCLTYGRNELEYLEKYKIV